MRYPILLTLVPVLLFAQPDARNEMPLREVANLQGVRGNMLMGYGLVVGLKGTGDTIQSKFTIQSLTNLLARQGISIPSTGLMVKNVASVLVTAELPAFARPGQRVDVSVSSTGDASSLAGGTLVMSPLQGPDGQVYVVGQGSVLVGGFSVATTGASNTKNHPTAGRIPNGGLVEREVAGNFNDRKVLRYSLLEDDFTTAVRVERAINKELATNTARALDARTIEVPLPPEFQGHPVELAARLENLPIELQTKARVVVNEKTGTVIMGTDVHIGSVSIVQAGISISVATSHQVSQPAPLSKGRTKTTATSDINVKEEKVKSLTLEPGTTVGHLAEMLNEVGVTPRDLVAILQAMKDAGALNADLRVL